MCDADFKGGHVSCVQRAGTNLLEDARFGAMFEDKDYQVDTQSEEYRLLNPVLARLQLSKAKHQQAVLDKFDAVAEVSGSVFVWGGGV